MTLNQTILFWVYLNQTSIFTESMVHLGRWKTIFAESPFFRVWYAAVTEYHLKQIRDAIFRKFGVIPLWFKWFAHRFFATSPDQSFNVAFRHFLSGIYRFLSSVLRKHNRFYRWKTRSFQSGCITAWSGSQKLPKSAPCVSRSTPPRTHCFYQSKISIIFWLNSVRIKFLKHSDHLTILSGNLRTQMLCSAGLEQW